MLKEFEIGPIRPPSEASSLLLRITRNCSWNKCKFCDLYKTESFKTRPIGEIKGDIDQVVAYREDILSWLPPPGSRLDQREVYDRIYQFPQEIAERYFYILNWMLNGGERSIFLQDANTMALSFDKLIEILTYIREKLPHVERITSYGRVDALQRFSVEQLTALKEAGLNRIHSGYETGADRVLELIQKGYTKAQEIEAGKKVKASGIELSVYVMPGVGGLELSEENARETADVISQVNPDFVRIRTFVAKQGTGMMEEIETGRITECTDKQKLWELKAMIRQITGTDGFLYSDHIINLLEEINGSLSEEGRRHMLDVIEEFESLPADQQRRFQLARRMGMVRTPGEMELLGAQEQEKIRLRDRQFADEQELEVFLNRLLRRYI